MSKAKKAKGPTDLGPDSDPKVLYNNYVRECKAIGIEPYGPLKEVLTNEENPNVGKQIIVLPPSTEGGRLGAGGCRALVNAMIMKNDDATTQVPPFTATKEIRLCRCDIKDGGASAIGTLLKATATKRNVDSSDPSAVPPEWKLEYIELMDNDIGIAGALALGRSLCVGQNKTLGKKYCTNAMLHIFISSYSSAPHTQATLVLDFNRTIGSEGVHALCRGLQTNSSLKKLSLKHCNIDEHGGKPISEMLGFKRLALISLDLTSNSIGGKGLSDVCDGLSINTSLKTLRLADNSVGETDDDIKALEKFAGVLVKHPSLIAVDLLHNRIGTNGGTLLLPAIQENKQITEFKVDSRGMDDELFKSLFRASTTTKKKKGKKKGKKK